MISDTKKIKKNVRDYFSDWEGWSCDVDDCGEVIENTRKELQRHLKEEHNIDVELDI
jgi:hypothetical protein